MMCTLQFGDCKQNVQIPKQNNQFAIKTLSRFNAMYLEAQQREIQKEYFPNRYPGMDTDMISSSHVCQYPLDELKNISVTKLKLNQINYGSKLEAKTITKPFQQPAQGYFVIIQDSENNVIPCHFHNYFSMHSPLNVLASILPIGSNIVIKEPYYKNTEFWEYEIRIDNTHCNFMIIDKYIKLSTNPEILKMTGNQYVTKKQYANAIKYYSAALQIDTISTELRLKLLSNRMLCLLKLHRFKEASIDGKTALELHDDSIVIIKVKYRLSAALTGIGRYNESLHILDGIRHKNDLLFVSMKNDIDKLYQQTIRNQKESINEPVHIDNIAFDYKSIDCETVANFYNDIEIKYINKIKGRGIVATSNLKAGDYILIERFIVSGLHDDRKHFLSYCSNGNKCAMGQIGQVNLVQNMVKIFRSGNIVDKYRISLLHGGNNKNVPNMDVFKYYELSENVNVNDIKPLSVNEMDEIASKNQFGITYQDTDEFKGLAVFGVASFFNHDDNPNATYKKNKNTIYVMLTKNVKKAEEICIRYNEKGVGSWTC